jgi:exopolysaccharide biosynthesis polyprenyl glycosylphosphotransferase
MERAPFYGKGSPPSGRGIYGLREGGELGARAHDGGGIAIRHPSAALKPRLLGLFGRADARWIAEAGRAVTIWVPVFVLAADRAASPATSLLVASIISTVWFLTIRSAFGAVPFTLGPAVPTSVGTLTGLVVVSALHFWIPLPGVRLSVSTLALMAISVFALATCWEAVWRRQIAAKRRVLVIGTSSWARDVAETADHAPNAPYRVVGIVDDTPGRADGPVPVLGPVADLTEIVEAQHPDLIVLADGDSSGRALDSLLDVASSGFKVVGVTHFFEHAFGWVPLRHLTPSWFMSILHLHQRTYSRFAKRTLDVIGASIGMILAAPIVPVIMLLVRRTPGRIIYRQTRVGEGGKLFTMYKFRTMAEDAEEPGRPVFAEENDPRVTRFGRALRKTHLDELPQLWNVLKGEMSIVGPRPERPEFVRMLENTVPFLARRLLIKPGITGWAQLRCDYASDSESAADRLSYDLWYLRHRNLTVDLAICAKTFSALLFHPGR